MSDMLDNLKKHLDSEEGQKSLKEWAEKITRKERMHESQLKRFKTKFGSRFSEIVEKIQAKYSSNKYKDSWYKRGIEPPEDMFYFLFDYAEKYGRPATHEELQMYGNCFTGGLFYIDGFFFNKMHGQGTCVLVEKQKQ